MTTRKTTWTTYRITGYTHDAAQDQRSAGGIHCHQIRRTRSGWQYRIEQRNGRHSSYGPVQPISEAEGAAKYAIALHAANA